MAVIGIDLGTTNSLVSICQNGKPALIPNALGELITPSIVSYDESKQDILIGNAAKQRLLSHPRQTVAAFKRAMGTNTEFLLGKQKLSAIELSTLLLKQLKQDAEAYLEQEVTEAVISVPAYFSDAQRNATKLAGEMAGLKVDRLINEPTAAALAYDLANKQEENLFVVIDLGGGTLDVSILDVFDKIIEVRASAGDNFLGGEDFSILMIDEFLRLNQLQETDITKECYSQLCARIEALKHNLSKQFESTLNIEIAGKPYTWTLSRETFQTLVKPLIRRFIKPIERALRDSRIKVNEINNIVLVGGATRMPWVRSEVSKLFKRLPDTSIHPDHVVALGASVQAALKAKDAAFEDLVLTDVCPYTLGVEVSMEVAQNQYESGHFLPIIERNSTVPISREKPLQTVRDNQTQINCQIFQGESRLTKNNVLLGSIEAKVPKGKAGEQGVSIRFTYDINGILEVIIKVETSGDTFRAIISNEASKMSKDEIEASLKKLEGLKIHPREDAKNAELMARLDRIYEESLGEKREYVAELSRQFEILLDKQESDDIEYARQQIADIAIELEQY